MGFRALVVVLWVVSLLAVAAVAQQTVPRQLLSQTQGAAVAIIGTPDVAFRVEGWEGNVPVGRWVVRHPVTGGQWVEPRMATGIKTLTAK